MSTKIKLFSILEKNKDSYVSGQELADILSVSRTAIWKAVKDLREDGHKIEAVTNKGYSLIENSSKLSAELIMKELEPENHGINIKIYKTIDSTNNEAKRLIMEDAGALDTVIFSEEQTSGKGRRGKGFVSPKGDNIYVSFILKPMVDVRDSLLITVGASVAVARTIEKIQHKTGNDHEVGIKWVNDIFVGGKKVCGILTEAVSDLESGQIQNLILGIGININSDINKYPDELKDIVGSVDMDPGFRNSVAGILINEVFKMQNEIVDYVDGATDEPAFMKEYRERSIVLNRNIYVLKDNTKLDAYALDINKRGGLLIKYKTGETETLSTGEISIRLND